MGSGWDTARHDRRGRDDRARGPRPPSPDHGCDRHDGTESRRRPPLQVVIGYELFQSCVVRFDYPAGVMDVWDAKHAPRHLEGVTVPMTLENNHPYVGGTLMVPGRPPLEGRFVIDTGKQCRTHPRARGGGAREPPRRVPPPSRGDRPRRGRRRVEPGRARHGVHHYGDLTFTKPIVVMPDSGAGHIAAGGSIGNIGGQILGRCRVTFDYPRHTIGFRARAGLRPAIRGQTCPVRRSSARPKA